jgi:uncharacterized protein (TIGR02145 family)
MRKSQRFLKITLMGLLGLISITCQKEEALSENQILDSASVLNSQLKATNSASDYLLDLISMIEAMVSEGSLNKGNADALISKIKNAKKSIDKGNTNAASGQLNAFINQVKAFMDNGRIIMELGQQLIEKAENGIILSEGSFIDPRDGSEYSVVLIGDQFWMAENLSYLPSVSPSSSGSFVSPFYYVFGYEGTNVNEAKATNNYTTYGVLYNWPAAMAGAIGSNSNPSGVQGVCPCDWHLPSDAEWTQLTNYLGGEVIAGGKLKEAGYAHWKSPNTDATNESGFTALPGGYFYEYTQTYNLPGSYGAWWSSTENLEPSHPTFSFLRAMYYDSGEVGLDLVNGHKINGFSVRCVKD